MLVDGNLMRKSAKEGILQKCITQEDGVKLLLKIHSGSCGNHVALRTLVGKAFELVSIGPQPSLMQRTSSDIVKDANFSPNKYTCQHKSCRPSQFPGPSHAGDWI